MSWDKHEYEEHMDWLQSEDKPAQAYGSEGDLATVCIDLLETVLYQHGMIKQMQEKLDALERRTGVRDSYISDPEGWQ